MAWLLVVVAGVFETRFAVLLKQRAPRSWAWRCSANRFWL